MGTTWHLRPKMLLFGAALLSLCRATQSDEQTKSYPSGIHVTRKPATGGFRTYDVVVGVNGKRPDVLIPLLPEMEVYAAERSAAPDWRNVYMTEIRARLPVSSVARCLSFYDGAFWDREEMMFGTGNYIAQDESAYIKHLAAGVFPANVQLAINLHGHRSFELVVKPPPDASLEWAGKVDVWLVTAPFRYGMGKSPK